MISLVEQTLRVLGDDFFGRNCRKTLRVFVVRGFD